MRKRNLTKTGHTLEVCRWELDDWIMDDKSEDRLYYQRCSETGMAFERVLGRKKSRRVAHPRVLLGSRKITLLDSEKVEVGGIQAMVLYDKGSNITLVSSAFVQKQGIKGKPATGTVECGAVAEGKPVQILAVHELPVQCGLGPMKTLTAYEVPNIGMETKEDRKSVV